MSMQSRDEMILRDICKELGKIRAELHTLNIIFKNKNENENNISDGVPVWQPGRTVIKEADDLK